MSANFMNEFVYCGCWVRIDLHYQVCVFVLKIEQKHLEFYANITVAEQTKNSLKVQIYKSCGGSSQNLKNPIFHSNSVCNFMCNFDLCTQLSHYSK
jgi:hypothetical protein